MVDWDSEETQVLSYLDATIIIENPKAIKRDIYKWWEKRYDEYFNERTSQKPATS
jgi:hypothetical protein